MAKYFHLFLILIGCAILAFVLTYSNNMVHSLNKEENTRVRQWAQATQLLASADVDDSQTVSLLLDIIQDNNTIPVIITDSASNVILYRNISDNDSTMALPDIQIVLEKMKQHGTCIDIDFDGSIVQKLYFSNSRLIDKLAYYPLVQLALCLLFILFAYFVFSRARRMEQDKVWIGLARETAHQLGTPISALMGWQQILESGEDSSQVDKKMISQEMKRDVERLKTIADRFSKIGSQADLKDLDLSDTITQCVDYLRRRIPSRINIKFINETKNLSVKHNATLIGWAIENICRNSLDAIEVYGDIIVSLKAYNDKALICISDNGKGMTKSVASKIFSAGYTTKTRGWGIGLALAKRIVVEYHKGVIYVADSEVGKGTTIAISLKVESHK